MAEELGQLIISVICEAFGLAGSYVSGRSKKYKDEKTKYREQVEEVRDALADAGVDEIVQVHDELISAGKARLSRMVYDVWVERVTNR